MWLFRSDFPSCSESEMQKNMDKIASNSTPTSLPVSKQRRISILESQNTVSVSFTLLVVVVGGGGTRRAGGLSRTCLKPCFPACGKKSTEKESACQISADSEQLGKSLWNSHIWTACTEPLNYPISASNFCCTVSSINLVIRTCPLESRSRSSSWFCTKIK